MHVGSIDRGNCIDGVTTVARARSPHSRRRCP